MTLEAGHNLGPYEILAPIAAGGMGEVSRARDTRLERSVAIKVLPEGFAKDEQFRQRFEREARTISQLSHPHICVLHDVGEKDGQHFLVLELLDGESLADRLSRGPLPLHEVLRFGAQIAQALDAAHRTGITHRDLKPGNVMLTKSGAKLLDFGLAKVGSEAPSGVSSMTSLPTEARPLTEQGTILGTFQYMAPEQLEGLEADARTDIFALGALLYEMTTGKRAFEGGSRTSLIAAIVSSQPTPVSTLQPTTPPALDHVVRKCLEKDPEDRWQSAHDIAGELSWVSQAGSQAGVAAPVTLRRKTRERLAWVAAALGLLATAAILTVHLREPVPEARPTLTQVLPPENTTFQISGANGVTTLTVSPDGRLITFLAKGADGQSRLWLRPLDSAEAHPLNGTEDAANPFWSPDSRFIAFFARGKLHKVDVGGGPPLPLCDVGLNPRRGSWNNDDVIIFSPSALGGVHSVPAAGGTPEPLTVLDNDAGETTHRWATFLPDGHHFLYMAGTHEAGIQSETNAIYLTSLESAERQLLLRARSNVEYADGYLLYVRDRILVAHPFDADRRELIGDPVPVAEGIQYSAGTFVGVFSASRDGVLVYRLGEEEEARPLEWVGPDGATLSTIGKPANYELGSLSPDGQRLAVEIRDGVAGTTDVWIVDLRRNVSSRLTFRASDDSLPIWSPDGSQVAFAGLNDGVYDIFVKAASGQGDETLIGTSELHKFADDWSPDGRHLALTTFDPSAKKTQTRWILDIESGSMEPVDEPGFDERNGRFSPDARWMAYESRESGRWEVYVAPFPAPGGKWQVSSDGGSLAFWSQTGDQLYFRNGDALLVVDVTAQGDSLEIGSPRKLFEDPSIGFVVPNPTGERFVVGRNAEETRNEPITVVTDWTQRLPQRDRGR